MKNMTRLLTLKEDNRTKFMMGGDMPPGPSTYNNGSAGGVISSNPGNTNNIAGGVLSSHRGSIMTHIKASPSAKDVSLLRLRAS